MSLFGSILKPISNILGGILGIKSPEVTPPPAAPTIDQAAAAAEDERQRLRAQAGFGSTIVGGLLAGNGQTSTGGKQALGG